MINFQRWILLSLLFSPMLLAKGRDWDGNWLLGVSGLLVENKAHLDLGLVYTALPPIIPATYLDFEQTERHYQWELLGGYQWKKNGWIFGAELNVAFQHSNQPHFYAFTDESGFLGWTATTEYQETPTLGLTGRMGYEMTPYFLPYIRLGIQTSRDQLDVTVTANPALVDAQLNLQTTQWQHHLVAGFGAELPLYACLALRLEYNYIFTLKNQAMEVSRFLAGTAFDPAITAQTHPRSQVGKVSLVWNFA